jgi:uncharacterized glyoxalase superfamily protein PhnB
VTRPYKQKDFPALTPFMAVRNVSESIAFYERAFGFKICGEPLEHDGRVMHAELALGEAKIMLGWEGGDCGFKTQSPRTSGAVVGMLSYVYVPNVDSFFKHAQTNGAEVMQEPKDQFWGDRVCTLRDQDGYVWNFATNVADFDPTKMPKM